MVDIFKKVKRELKNKLGDIQDDLDSLDEEHKFGPAEQKDKIEGVRLHLNSTDKHMRDLEYQWSILKPTEKGYYRPKLAKLRSKLDHQRHRFFRIEDEVDSVFKDYQKERNARYRLTDGLSEIDR